MKKILVLLVLACAMVFASAQWHRSVAQELKDAATPGQADTLIAVARMDLGLAFDEALVPAGPDSVGVRTSIDYTDTGPILDRLRILTKELSVSGRYSKAEFLDIKLALSEAERDLERVPEGAQRSGREAVERYFAVLEAM
jgi:hypothetical protein